MGRDAQVIAIIPAHAQAAVGAAQDAVSLDVHAVHLLDYNAILDGNAITLRAAGRLVPGVRLRSFGRADRQRDEKAERE
jgi:hypothetical protein